MEGVVSPASSAGTTNASDAEAKMIELERDSKRPRLDEDEEETPPGTPEVREEFRRSEAYWSPGYQQETTFQQEPEPATATYRDARRAAQRDASVSRLSYGVQCEVSELWARMPRLREELEACCYDSLGDFDESTGREIVAKFGSRDLTGVRSATAYFCGLLKRYRALAFAGTDPAAASSRQHHHHHHMSSPQRQQNSNVVANNNIMAPNNNGLPPTPPRTSQASSPRQSLGPEESILSSLGNNNKQRRGLQHVAHTAQGLAEQASSIASLAPAVRDAIEDIFRLDGVRRIEMEPCCFESLRDFAEPVALRIVRDFRNADMRTLRDKTAFFCSILKRYRAQAVTHGKIFGRSAQIALGRGPGSSAYHLPHSMAALSLSRLDNNKVNVITPQSAVTTPRRLDADYDNSPWAQQQQRQPVGTRAPYDNRPGSNAANNYQVYAGEDPYSISSPVAWPYAYHPGLVAAPPAYYASQANQGPNWGYMA